MTDYSVKEFTVGTFRQVKEGDVVTRLLAGTVEMKLTVTNVTNDLIVCGVPGMPDAEGWTFDRDTGAEIDEEIGWGPKYGRTGSYLIEKT